MTNDEENASWIKTKTGLTIFIEDTIYTIFENDKRFQEIENLLLKKDFDTTKMMLDPLKHGLLKTKHGIVPIVKFSTNPLRMTVLIKGQFTEIKSFDELL